MSGKLCIGILKFYLDIALGLSEYFQKPAKMYLRSLIACSFQAKVVKKQWNFQKLTARVFGQND